jgi:hypothetical protein
MSTKTEQSQARVEERRRRKHAKADRRRRDRALVPVCVAQRVGIPVADLARAIRASGVHRQLTEAEAKDWIICDLETAPEWFTTLLGERLARAAEAEYRREQAEEQRQLRELAVEQSAWAKIQAGKRRFSDDEWAFVHDWAFRAAKDLVRSGPEADVTDEERRVLLAVGVDVDDHSTWPVHAGGCDGEGAEHCAVRMEQMSAERRVDALIDSIAKKTALRDLALSRGQFVTTWHGARVGRVVKVNKVTVKVRLVGGQGDRHAVVEKNLDPRYVRRIAPESLPSPPEPGGMVPLREHCGHTREAQVVAVDGPLFEVTYSLKSGQWRSAWFDLAAIQPTAGES